MSNKVEGFLTKLGYKSGKWQPRYFILDNDFLRYYVEHPSVGQAKPKGEIPVSSIQVAERITPGTPVASDASTTSPKKPVGPFALRVAHSDGKKTRSYYMLASSPEEQLKWVKALQPLKGEPVKLPPTELATSKNGAPVADPQFSLRAGPMGPLALQDWQIIEKHTHFNRERIPERIVHAKGSGAYGEFTVTHDISQFTKANFLSQVGKKTEVFFRFSTVAGEMGAADAERDVRGVAMRFYTDEGNFDIVGNNTPVFFLRDPALFPDFVHTQKRDVRTNMRDGTAAWKYWSEHPESLHQVTILMSDRGIPKGYRFMNAYSSHTLSFINSGNKRFYVKWHLKTKQGHAHYTNPEAAEIVGGDRESSQRDLYEAIERGDFPRWAVKVQIMPEEDVGTTPFDPFDLTKVWPHKSYPLQDVGILELNRNPEDYFAEVEQAAFAPKNVVPGTGHSPDPVLQMRIFSYLDAQNYRLGGNHHLIPVNRARCPLHNPQYRAGRNCQGTLTDPNFSSDAKVQSMREPPLKLEGDLDRHVPRSVDDWEQPGNLFRIFDDGQKQRLFSNIADAMTGVPQEIIDRQLAHFDKADPAYGEGVRKALAAKRQ